MAPRVVSSKLQRQPANPPAFGLQLKAVIAGMRLALHRQKQVVVVQKTLSRPADEAAAASSVLSCQQFQLRRTGPDVRSRQDSVSAHNMLEGRIPCARVRGSAIRVDALHPWRRTRSLLIDGIRIIRELGCKRHIEKLDLANNGRRNA